MDDDLQTLATALAEPDPTPDMVDRSRHRLEERMRGPVHRRRTGWLTAGLGLTAAAAAAAVVVGSGVLPTTPGSSPTVTQTSGRQVLLAAATTAAEQPAGSGAYWHVKTVSADGELRYETWVGRDGQTWARGAKTDGRLVKLTRPSAFRLAGVDLSVEAIQNLPTDPAALKARIAGVLQHGEARTSAGAPAASEQDERVLVSLAALVSQLPAPPTVRAAAFRAIATYPNVTSLGVVDGGDGVLISLRGKQARLVVDPATSQVRGTNFFVTADGAEVWLASGRAATVTSGWTNDRPVRP